MLYSRKIQKLYVIAIIFMVSGLSSLSVNAQAKNVTPMSVEAEAIVNRYFTALIDGKTDSLRILLGPKLQKRNARMLSNPAYRLKLHEFYRDAEYTIKGSDTLDATTVAVNVEVKYSNEETSQLRFILKKVGQSAMRIYAEEHPLN